MKQKFENFVKENRDQIIRKGTIVVMSIVGLVLVGVVMNREAQPEYDADTMAQYEEPEPEPSAEVLPE